MIINVVRTDDRAQLPVYSSQGAACFDLFAVLDEAVTVTDSHPVVISTGLAFDIPDGYVMQIYSRSGYAFKSDTRLANCVGIIDSDYTGTVQVKLTCDSHFKYLRVNHGDRIAQAMILPVSRVSFFQMDNIKSTERGSRGFGSTGQ